MTALRSCAASVISSDIYWRRANTPGKIVTRSGYGDGRRRPDALGDDWRG
jgi:hypothetical protein